MQVKISLPVPDFIKNIAKEVKSHQFITEDHIRAIHKIILSGINDVLAGKYRATEVFIRGSTEFPMPLKVPHLMQEFTQWLEGQQETHPIRVAADSHFKLVSIHPFIDGNGRVARLLMNLILIINGYPMAVIRNEDRVEYLSTFDVARNDNNMKPFYNIIELAVERSLDAYLNAAREKQSFLSPFKTSKS